MLARTSATAVTRRGHPAPAITPAAGGRLPRAIPIGERGDPFERAAESAAAAMAPRAVRAGPQLGRGPEAPEIVHAVLGGTGSPLEPATLGAVGRNLGHDFSGVRVHRDARAAASADAVRADAYTVGRHVVFGRDMYAPHTGIGRALLAHELTHVAQQAQAGTTWLQRAEKLGTKIVEPKGAKPPFKTAAATFDGGRFVLTGDGTTILDVPAQSGHPNTVEKADATACGGSESDSYLNNVRYVGIKDRGAIPEGEYTFRHSRMVRFSGSEQARMALAKPGEFVDPVGLGLHGDWGAGRAALTPVRILPSRFCGNTAARSGFYLHGGVMTGSSGCIDIGNDGITTVIDRLMGFLSPVPVKVRYTKPAPTVGTLQRKAGEFMYPGKKDPSITDRVKSVLGLD
jgi:hypothetical protein